ncbi:hypothetical protein EYF80_022908 [Liparis tanakae]|uniref:Uncharacterized protein n=1 Tax=Liparis tanakae TaxID=230148 RepID=A0A4Z2HLR9_9TELE|nr:hypothetical protein EYF80_022908 [Liparis tanakae]
MTRQFFCRSRQDLVFVHHVLVRRPAENQKAPVREPQRAGAARVRLERTQRKPAPHLPVRFSLSERKFS